MKRMDRRLFFVILWLGLATSSPGVVCSFGEMTESAGNRNDVASDQTAAGADETTSPLYLLTYDHGGIVLWGRDHFLNHLRNAISWLDRYPGFKIGLDNEAYAYDYLFEHDPAALEELRGYLKRYHGRFGIGSCTYGQPLSQFINEESNIRQIGYALDADQRHLGCAPAVYLMSEHAMHSQIPQILVGFGFTGSIMRTHFMMYGYNPTFNVATGWWVGLDGSRIRTVPTYEGQGAEFGRTTMDNWILTRYPGPECKTPLEDFRTKFAHIKPLLASRADDAKLRREELVRTYEGNPEYVWVLLEEIFRTFPPPTKELRTVPNDFRVRMPWGYCGNEIWNMSRRAEVEVLTAERLAAAEFLLGGVDHEGDQRQAWKNLLVGQHHDIQICGLLDDARKFLPASIAASIRVKDASLGCVASRMKGGNIAQVTVFNPHSWRRREWIEVGVSLPRAAAKNIRVLHGTKDVPSALLSAECYSDGSIRECRMAVAADLPPLGLVSYSIAPAKETPSKPAGGIEIDAETLEVTTPDLAIRLNAEGGISSLVDRRTGKSFLRAGMRSGFFAGKIDGQACESKGAWVVEMARGGAPWAVAQESGLIGGIPYTLMIKVRADTRWLDCRATFHFDGQRIGRLSENKRESYSPFLHEEKLRFKFFPAVGEDAVGVRDLPFAIAETTDRYMEGNYWTALADNRLGVALFNRGTMGSVRESDGGFSVPLAYAMYYVWGTRMLKGGYTYEFAIYPFAGQWAEADLHRRALEYSFPCVSLCTAPGDGRLGSEVRLLDVSSSDVMLSALYNEKGRAYARLYEHRGRPSQVSVKCLVGEAKLTEVDLAGREIEPVSGPLAFRPWQIRTVCIEPLE